MISRVLLLIPTTSYKTHDFIEAAGRLGVELVVGTDRTQALQSAAPGHTLAFDLQDLPRTLHEIDRFAAEPGGLRAVIGVDDETATLAGMASASLGLPHNSIEALRATRDKFAMRSLLAEAGRPGPHFRRCSLDDDPIELAAQARFPGVLKPVGLSASRGVIRVDDAGQFRRAFARIARILDDPEIARLKGDARQLIFEQYLPGEEVAIEALLDAGQLRVLALFDKPDPLDGPVFEETLLVTPSRKAPAIQQAIIDETRRGCRALGFVHGPIHAELRITDGRAWLVEIAARTIGGICSRTLRFGDGLSLEELVLSQALGLCSSQQLESRAAGVMMLPIPRGGILREVRGIDAARRTRWVEQVTMTMHRGDRVVPLPEGHRYLGFVFARGETPAQVETALRTAHSLMEFEIEAD